MGPRAILAVLALLAGGAQASEWIVYDNFGADDLFDYSQTHTAARWITDPWTGWGSIYEYAASFTVTGGDGYLDSVTLALGKRSGASGLSVRLCEDDGGRPGDSLQLLGGGSWPTITVGSPFLATTLDVRAETPLVNGETYWIVTSPSGSSDRNYQWGLNSLNVTGRVTSRSGSVSMPPFPTWGYPVTQVMPALRIMATDTPATPLPVADAGGPYEIVTGAVLALDASGSYSPSPSGVITSWEWDLDYDGVFETPALGERSDQSYAYLESLGLGVGDWHIRLRVTDGWGESDTAIGSLTITHQPPVADAGGPYNIHVGDILRLDASGSYCPEPGGTISGWQWDLNGDGVFETTAPSQRRNYTYAYLESLGLGVGGREIALRVTDDWGGSDIATTSLMITPDPPVADAGGPYEISVGGMLRLDASGSYCPDPDGEITGWEWDLDDDGIFESEARSASQRVMYAHLQSLGLCAGEWDIHVKVTDCWGGSTVGTTTLTIVPEPATLVLLALGGLAVVRRRRR